MVERRPRPLDEIGEVRKAASQPTPDRATTPRARPSRSLESNKRAMPLVALGVSLAGVSFPPIVGAPLLRKSTPLIR